MKTLQVLLITLFLSINAYCGDTLYYAPLRNSLKIVDVDYKSENLKQLANCCERIVGVYKNEWLPYYYEAYAYINLSFNENNVDKKEILCDKAQVLIDSALKVKPNESELYTLQCLLYFTRMSINPMINGPIYLVKSSSALEEAQRLNPINPRIYFLRGKLTVNTPKFFGGGKEAALPILEIALQKYTDFKPESNVHPYWGKEGTERLLKECKPDSL